MRPLASSSQFAPTNRCLRRRRTPHPWAARCPASATTSRCDGTSTRTRQAGKPGPPRPFPLLVLKVFVLSLQLGCDIGGRHVRHIPPVLVPPAPALRPDGRADVVPREHLTRHLCDLISPSDAVGVPEELAIVPVDLYLIAKVPDQFTSVPAGLFLMAEAPHQFTSERLLGHQLAQVIPRNADAPVVAHGRTIATLRTGTRTITAADPLPGHLPDALDRIYRHSGTP